MNSLCVNIFSISVLLIHAVDKLQGSSEIRIMSKQKWIRRKKWFWAENDSEEIAVHKSFKQKPGPQG